MSKEGSKRRGRKERSEARGRLAEYLAVIWYQLRGYRLVALRWRGRRGEIDLIVRRGRMIVFVEVKYRATRTKVDYALSPFQQQRIMQAAEEWYARQSHSKEDTLRFDAFLVAPFTWPRVIADAFRP